MTQEATPFLSIKPEHGEGPVWCPIEEKFYFVDLLKGTYFKVDYKTEEVEHFEVGQPLGVMALREKGGIVVAVRDGFGFFDEETGNLELIADSPEFEVEETRMNDGAVDPAGRFLAATMTYDGSKSIGNLYALEEEGRYQHLEKELILSNGMGWSPDNSKFYLIDTHAHVMYAYDYNIETGEISNRSIFIQWSKNEYPDGMAIDSEGGFWVAIWGAGKVSHFNAEGEFLEDFLVPVAHTTSCCFGGPDLTTLLITTSNLPLTAEEKSANPLAGRIFKLETNTKGQIQRRYKG
jgi:sugar lactone lactonase YvrE